MQFQALQIRVAKLAIPMNNREFPQEKVEKLSLLFSKLGPPYISHWDAWVAATKEPPPLKQEDPIRFFQQMELEACSAGMMERAFMGAGADILYLMRLHTRNELLIDSIARTVDKYGKLHNLTEENIENHMKDARLDHWRVFPHPPDMVMPEVRVK